jgi:hypothetical protein
MKAPAIALIGILPVLSSTITGTPLGSYTINFGGTAPTGTIIRLTATFGPRVGGGTPAPIDIPFNISGLTNTQATNNLLGQLSGTDASLNGTNSINITGTGTGRQRAEITKIDGDSNNPLIAVALDGNVPTQTVAPGQKWVAFFGPGIDSPLVTTGGALTFVTPDAGTLSTFLNTGTTPGAAAVAFGSLLQSDGFLGVQVDAAAAEVSFLNSPSGTPIGSITQFSFGGANLDVGLQFPAEIPEPDTLGFVAAGVLSFLALAVRRPRETRGNDPDQTTGLLSMIRL